MNHQIRLPLSAPGNEPPGASSLETSTGTLEACLLTPSGRGAVATIGVRGMISTLDHDFQAANGRRISSQSINRICFGTWGSRPPGEEIVLVRTAERNVELHCHGGQAAIDRILRDVKDRGGKILDPEKWSRGDNSSLIEQMAAECQLALTRATTQKTSHHLLRQCHLLPAEVEKLLNLPELQQRERLAALLRWSQFGLHLTVPWKVGLCGRPNVGKSSLINALVGYTRSIVFDQPGTTRDVITVETAFDGWPFELTDTAGIRDLGTPDDADEQLESAGILRARQRLRQADVITIVVDAATGLQQEDHDLIEAFPNALIVMNKTDLTPENPAASKLSGAISCSAKTGAGISDLIDALINRVVPEEPDDLTPVPVTTRQVGWLEHWEQEVTRIGQGRGD